MLSGPSRSCEREGPGFLRRLPRAFTYGVYLRRLATAFSYGVYLRRLPTAFTYGVTYGVYLRRLPTVFSSDVQIRLFAGCRFCSLRR
jgi:hypothetical protein